MPIKRKRAAGDRVEATRAPQRGRPTKLNAETTKKICDAIIVGATYEASAQYAGITYQTFLNWMHQGEQEGEGAYFEFFGTVTQANASAQVYFATNIKQAASNGDWRAASWMLERRFSKAYGLRVGAIDENELDHAIESELARLGAARQNTDVGETAVTTDPAR